ncbi:hypothetical protein HMPREF0083_04277 [Aneurinibacillus aneurinilyticus ATCC 12856]|uniref:Uncharacterized protein n=1 Tax=Aneurinibacillus aneurinilyticus ATCC 12856 TaxID=649747 RepID=U1WZB1_ANEAE|nr:hypothetical protein HMPREF0083_04277 [Aneurinibacillus aneurinilyticus ATCC 12856]
MKQDLQKKKRLDTPCAPAGCLLSRFIVLHYQMESCSIHHTLQGMI